MLYYNNHEKCVIKDVLEIVGGKWAIPIIFRLLEGTKRFKELERSIPGINTRMLVKELKNLELKNVIFRQPFPTVPPTVEYSLTSKGEELRPIINALYVWGESHSKQDH